MVACFFMCALVGFGEKVSRKVAEKERRAASVSWQGFFATDETQIEKILKG